MTDNGQCPYRPTRATTDQKQTPCMCWQIKRIVMLECWSGPCESLLYAICSWRPNQLNEPNIYISMVVFRLVWFFSTQACRDFLTLAQTHSKRWQKALQAEREQRVRLEETLEQLAKQHNHLERAFRGAAQANASADSKSKTVQKSQLIVLNSFLSSLAVKCLCLMDFIIVNIFIRLFFSWMISFFTPCKFKCEHQQNV